MASWRRCGWTGLMQPSHGQILQPAKGPAADPHRFVDGDLEPAGTGEQGRQCDVGNHGARGPGTGAEMRTGAERDALGRITPHVELVGALKMLLVAVGGTEHEEYAFIGFERDVADGPWLCDASRRHADRGDPAGIFLEGLEPRHLALAHEIELLGMAQQRPHRAGDRLARLVLAAGYRELDVGTHALHRHARCEQYAEDALVGMLAHHGQ